MRPPHPSRREALAGAGALALAVAAPAKGENKVSRIGVISASIGGKPQKTNGHTWHFAQYFHPTINLDVIKKYLDPGSAKFFASHLRNPRYNFDALPFPDTRITHVYDADRLWPAVHARLFRAAAGASRAEDAPQANRQAPRRADGGAI